MYIEDPRVIYSIQAALVFLVIASPFMYNLVQSILGRLVTVAKGGCPHYGWYPTPHRSIWSYSIRSYASCTQEGRTRCSRS